jgi:glutamate-1-semialdehyde 2,1-aminomutase
MTKTIEQLYCESFPNAQRLHERARGIFPNGVTHDNRYLQPFPPYVERAEGSRKWDVDGHELIDYFVGHGALLLGHSHPKVVEAVQTQMAKGTHYGACHELEIEWGARVQQLIPSAEMVRFTASGTEATLMALRLCRMFTGKRKFVKFLGHFHGWHDQVMPAIEPPLDDPTVPGVPPQVIENTVLLPPNDIAAVERTLETDKDIACLILEPTGGHFGRVPLREGFLKDLRAVTAKHGVILIFDEVITGFRVSPGGAQAYYGVTPDMTTLAKVLCGGLPGGAVAGRRDIMEQLQFGAKKKMRHPGTFNANPLSAAAGITTLDLVASGAPNRKANEAAASLRRQLNDLFEREGVNWLAYGEFSRWWILTDYHGPRPDSDDFIPYDYALHRLEVNPPAPVVRAFRQAMLLNGVDSTGMSGMTCAAHTPDDIEQTVAAVGETIRMMRAEGLVG